MNVYTKLFDPRCLPIRAHFTDAGSDLVAIEDTMIEPSIMKMVDTGVAVKIPQGYVGLVYSRSGQGKIRVHLANGTGVIDSGYRGNIKVMLVNDGTTVYKITAFDTKIAQLVVVPIDLSTYKVISTDEDWIDSDRGEAGFGSTG